VQYQQLITDVTRRIPITAEEARLAAEATIGALARTVDEPRRRRLLQSVPPAIGKGADEAPGPAPDQDSFVSEVSWLTGTPPEQARYRAQAVLATLAEHEPELVDALRLPEDLRQLCAEPAPGGGLIGPTGHAAPLTAAEVRTALGDLPDWTGDQDALRRTLTLPPANLDRVLARIERLHRDLGRGPDVARAGQAATITVRTNAARAVTAADVELAHRIDDAIIDAAGTPP
jgi:pterin-4a-carbinolamine dehydratase